MPLVYMSTAISEEWYFITHHEYSFLERIEGKGCGFLFCLGFVGGWGVGWGRERMSSVLLYFLHLRKQAINSNCNLQQ